MPTMSLIVAAISYVAFFKMVSNWSKLEPSTTVADEVTAYTSLNYATVKCTT